MKNPFMRAVVGAVALMALLAGPAFSAESHSGPRFQTTPNDPTKTYPKFHIGVSGIYATIEKGLLVTVDSTEPGTPAEGRFQKGDVLLKVNGKPVSEPEPYVALGNALTAAEASDGKLVFAVRRADKEENVEMVIPVLGAYSKTWPLNCKKSDAIVRQTAEFISQPENLKNPGFFGGLFLLSTGDDRYLPVVKELVERNSPDKAGSHTWNNGYQGILIGEYYLRTGDASALPRLKGICVDSAERQYYGGWNHWDSGITVGYTQGGLMNAAGVQILSTLILARECGVEVDQGTFDRALTFFYRFAGHAAVPYGDHRPEVGLSSNGKNGMLAGAMTLLDGKAYRMAAQTMSLDMADSYSGLGGGHAHSFGDHAWRGLGSVNLPEDKQDHHRRSLDKLTWYYDLCRRPKGGFSLLNLGAGVGEGVQWGHGVALAYTAPRKTLRITGAPHTKYSRKVEVPDIPWGRQRDIEFLRTDSCEGFGTVELEPHELYARISREANGSQEKADKAFLAKMMRHYSPVARTRAAQALGQLGAADEILAALQHGDPRVRRAGLDGITQYRSWSGGGKGCFPREVVSKTFLPSILKILNDQESAFWEIDGALLALGMCELEDVVARLDLVRPYLDHPEWWLRQHAAATIAALGGKEELLRPELPRYLSALAKELHIMPRRSMLGAMSALLTNDQVSREFRNLVAGGLLQSMNDTTVEPGPRGNIGATFLYELFRYTDLEKNPELGLQILRNYERGVPKENRGWWSAVFQGDVWGNPGLFRCADILSDRGEEKLAAEFSAEFKRQIPLVKQQRAATKDGRKIKSLDGLIEELVRRTDPDMSWRPFVATSKRQPQTWRYLMWNAATGPFVPTDQATRVPAAPPPDAVKNWHLPEFDDSTWEEGNGAFGVWRDLFQYLVETFNTEITKDHIFLRKTFTLDEESATLPLVRLHVLSREAVEIYLNGQSIYASDKPANRPRYQIVALGPEHKALLRKGRNTLAVATRINYFMEKPYGLIDVGLEGARTLGDRD